MIILILIFTLLWVKKLSTPFEEAIYWSIIILGVHISAFIWKIDIYITVIWLAVIVVSRGSLGHWTSRKDYFKGLILSLPFLAVASMPTRFLDAGRYYDQTVRWFQEGIPRGLANFDLYLIQASAAHSFEALGNALHSAGQNEVVPIVSAFLIVYTFLKHGDFTINSILIYFIFYLLLSNFFQCSSPDLLGIALITAYFFNDKRETSDYSKGVIALTLPLIKLTFIPFSLLFLAQLVFKKRIKVSVTLICLLVLLPLKTAYLAGWVPIAGILDVNWKIPQEAIEYLRSATIGQSTHNDGEYFLKEFNFRVIDLVVLLIYVLVLFFYSIKAHKKQVDANIIFMWTIPAFWIMVVPQGRFLIPFILYIVYISHKDGKWQNSTIPKAFTVSSISVLSLFVILPNWSNLSSNSRIQRFLSYSGFQEIRWIKPSDLWHIKAEEIQLTKEITYYKPSEKFECFDTEFPCNARIIKHFGGDSIYTPIYFKEEAAFGYTSQEYDLESKGRIKKLNTFEN